MNELKDYCYTELVEHEYKNRGTVVDIDTIQQCYPNTAYCQWVYRPYQYQDQMERQRFGHYNGFEYAPMLPFDFDKSPKIGDGSMVALKKHVVNFVGWLEAIHEIEPKALHIYYSGSKGFHVLVPSPLLGITPCKNITKAVKRFIELTFDADTEFHFDRLIYKYNQLLRLPNSKHPDSGRYKVPLSFHELRDLDIGEIEEISSAPRLDMKLVSPEDWSAIPEFEQTWRGIVECAESGIPDRVRAYLDKGVDEGNRHNAAFDICRFHRYAGENPTQIYARLVAWDRENRPPHQC